MAFTGPVITIREIQDLRIAPRFRADYPPVDVIVAMTVAIIARTRHRGVDQGLRTIAADVRLELLGTAQGSGYDLEPRRALLTAWWGCL